MGEKFKEIVNGIEEAIHIQTKCKDQNQNCCNTKKNQHLELAAIFQNK